MAGTRILLDQRDEVKRMLRSPGQSHSLSAPVSSAQTYHSRQLGERIWLQRKDWVALRLAAVRENSMVSPQLV